VAGQKNQKSTSAGALTSIWTSIDGKFRIGRSDGESAWFVFKRLDELDNFFAEMNLPIAGGSV
jgi:hypothetical protein